MSREDFSAASEIDRSGRVRGLGRDDSGWLRVSGRAGCEPVRAISRDEAARIEGGAR
ncbi:hypothetical protein ACFXHA_33095 [Nocardia sp. NPDC059240]|uniref:hypothetical protein n=1 Tax=Nocardia sp. NPDC059240 TaxID=3346786 RepID=UPI00369A8A80